jgi:polysaccharide export outer membrane protein
MVKTGSFFQWVLVKLRNETLLILLVAYAFFCQGCSATGVSNVSQNTDKKTAPVEDEYIIGPTDVLEIHVWREPDLSRTIPVRPDGKITLPLLSDVQASGLTPLELKVKIEKRLAEFVESATVSVAVQEIHSKNIFVLGQVASPGQYPLQQDLTVLQALSLAGGLAEWADRGNVVILREENGKQSRIKFDYKKVSKGKHLEKNIVLQPGDTIIVP